MGRGISRAYISLVGSDRLDGWQTYTLSSINNLTYVLRLSDYLLVSVCAPASELFFRMQNDFCNYGVFSYSGMASISSTFISLTEGDIHTYNKHLEYHTVSAPLFSTKQNCLASDFWLVLRYDIAKQNHPIYMN